MKATAIKDFTASVSGRDFKCGTGDEVEADAKTIAQLEAIGLVTTKQVKRGAKPRKAGNDD